MIMIIQQLNQNQIIFIYILTRMIILLFTILQIVFSFTSEDLQKTLTNINSSPLVNLMMIYDTATEKGPIIQIMVQEIAKRKKGYFQIHFIDCNQADTNVAKDFQYCSKQVRPQLPALMFSQPALNLINPETGKVSKVQHVQFQGSLDQKSLYQFAIPLMQTYSHVIKRRSDLAKLQQKYQNTSIIIFCTNKDKLSPFYKALTAHFRNTIVFGHVLADKQGNNALCKELGVIQYPVLLLHGKEPIKSSANLPKMIETLKQYEGPFTEIIISQKEDVSQNYISAEQMGKLVYEKEDHILINILGIDGKAHPEWDIVKKKFKKMFSYYVGEGQSLEKEIGVKRTPAIVYYPKSVNKKSIQKTIFSQHHKFQDIYNQISNLIEDYSVPLSSDIEMQQYTSLSLTEGRLVAVLFHSDEISLSYRVLSNEEKYKEAITFFRMKDPEIAIMQKFQLQKLPSLIVMINDQTAQKEENSQQQEKLKEKGKISMNLKVAQYTGKFEYDQLSTYLSYFVVPLKPQKENVPSTKQVKEILSSKSFKKLCLDEYCYLLLLDGREQNNEKNSLTLKQFNKLNGFANLAYLDGVCHSEIIGSLEILQDQLPTVVYLNAKLKKFGRLIGRVEESSLKNMGIRVKSGKLTYRAYENLQFQNKNCVQSHKKIKEMKEATQSSYLNEEEAAILQQIKREQEEKKKKINQEAEAAAGDSPKKKKKKRPKREWEQQL